MAVFTGVGVGVIVGANVREGNVEGEIEGETEGEGVPDIPSALLATCSELLRLLTYDVIGKIVITRSNRVRRDSLNLIF